MRLLHFLAFTLTLAGFLMGCDLGPQVCTGLAEPAIVVEVVDATTGQYIAAEAEGVIIDGSYRDSLRHSQITQTTPALIVKSLAAGFERAGTYDVRVERAGYEPWSRDDVEVPSGRCGPETQSFKAELEATGGK